VQSRFAVSSKRRAYRSTFWISLTSMRHFVLLSRAMERRAEVSLRQDYTFVCLGFDVASGYASLHTDAAAFVMLSAVKILSIRR
jgi:hypothetical protein